MENLLGGDFHGALFAVNPNHRRVLARRSYRVARRDRKAGRSRADRGAVRRGARRSSRMSARAGAKAAVIFSAPPEDPAEARRWQRELARRSRSRAAFGCVGPHSFGVIRTELGLNATVGTAIARPRPARAHRAVGRRVRGDARFRGVGRHRIFDGRRAGRRASTSASASCWTRSLVDPETDGILLYAENVGDARRFLSALRAAARTKPVVVLKAGRSMEPRRRDAPSPDAVFDAAMKRAGTVRVKTYTQLFAAARILAMNRIARGDRLAIVTNGHGPGTLAADSRRGPRHRAGRIFAGDRERACARCCRRTVALPQSDRRARRRDAAADRRRRRGRACRSAGRCGARAARRRARHRRHRRGARRRRRSRTARRSPCSARGSARSTGVKSTRRSRQAASRTSTRRKMPSRRSRSCRRTATIRSGCSRCLRRSPSRTRPTSRASSACAPTRHRPSARVLTGMETHTLLVDVRPARRAGGVGRHAERSARGRAAPRLSGDARIERAGRRNADSGASASKSACATAGC